MCCCYNSIGVAAAKACNASYFIILSQFAYEEYKLAQNHPDSIIFGLSKNYLIWHWRKVKICIPSIPNSINAYICTINPRVSKISGFTFATTEDIVNPESNDFRVRLLKQIVISIENFLNSEPNVYRRPFSF